ncbi:hypothetical protein ACFL51_01700 [Myxococcota bacterium]
MLERQLALRLNAETAAEAEALWRGLPASSRQEITRHHARLIERAAKLAAQANEREADDEHTEQSD